MSCAALLMARLELRGVTLTADGDALRYRAPSSATEGLEAMLAEQKGEILRLLRARRPSAGRSCGCGREITRGGLMCGACRARELGWTNHDQETDR